MNPSVRRRIRLVTGLVLFGYVIMHLLNLSLGLLSLEAMDAARPYILAPWQNPLGLLALYGSVMSHVVLGLESLYRRRTLRMTGFDALQF